MKKMSTIFFGNENPTEDDEVDEAIEQFGSGGFEKDLILEE